MTSFVELCVPCLFGLEGLVADELRRMNMNDVRPETGRVYFRGDWRDVARANIGLRTGERVLVTLGNFPAVSFDALYEGAAALDWAAYIPKDGAFPIKGHALGPALRSVPDAQRIIKKAAADQLGRVYGVERLPETGVTYQVQFAIREDVCTIYLDTTGAGLYKRGYRPVAGVAPLRETLAAAMVNLSRYRGRDVLADPFCGSGTIAIEAALAARNRAPGLNRKFAAETWLQIPSEVWDETREAARAKEFNGDYTILARDIDPDCIALARENARRAGVETDIHFEVADARKFETTAPKGVIVTNPPYGERVLEKSEADAIARAFGRAVKGLQGWQLYILSAHADFEQAFGRTADKKRKLYNGMMKCNLFMYK
ncbi:MAG: class I SAM-dependent RNA methyltransferase [Oscillospiraceae bacterium]|nr:class I SAM-dependent RNA methyltransferase [Oscillospiraceae bacterium]